MAEIVFYRELLQMQYNHSKCPLKDIELPRPSWMDENDPMAELYTKKAMLLQHGHIVYAHIVQANTVLFESFPSCDAPAHIIYSTEPHFTEHPEILREIAQEIYGYKELESAAVPDEWKDVASVIADEYDRSDFTLELKVDGASLAYRLIPTMIHRKLLPKGKLCGNLLPVLTIPNCKQVMILPKNYWTKTFGDAWVDGRI